MYNSLNILVFILYFFVGIYVMGLVSRGLEQSNRPDPPNIERLCFDPLVLLRPPSSKLSSTPTNRTRPTAVASNYPFILTHNGRTSMGFKRVWRFGWVRVFVFAVATN